MFIRSAGSFLNHFGLFPVLSLVLACFCSISLLPLSRFYSSSSYTDVLKVTPPSRTFVCVYP